MPATKLPVSPNARIEAHHLDQLDILERVLKESMRLYPPVIVIARTPTEPIELLGETFKPGDQLTIPIWCLHRNERLWDDPKRFDPDRFLAERDKDRPRGQYMPFGAGARICIGMSFALVEAKVILATLLQHASFEWERLRARTRQPCHTQAARWHAAQGAHAPLSV